LQLASAAEELYVKLALTELAEDFEKMAASLKGTNALDA
jgi:hypothetical protein